MGPGGGRLDGGNGWGEGRGGDGGDWLRVFSLHGGRAGSLSLLASLHRGRRDLHSLGILAQGRGGLICAPSLHDGAVMICTPLASLRRVVMVYSLLASLHRVVVCSLSLSLSLSPSPVLLLDDQLRFAHSTLMHLPASRTSAHVGVSTHTCMHTGELSCPNWEAVQILPFCAPQRRHPSHKSSDTGNTVYSTF